MSVSYCTSSDLTKAYAGVDGFDLKRRLPEFDFTTYAASVYSLHDAGYVGICYINSVAGTLVADVSSLSSDNDWYYDSDTDTLYIYSSAAINTKRVEAAPDTISNLKTAAISDASEWVESVLDVRFPRPLTKSSTGSYDYVLRHLTALKAVAILMYASQPDNPVVPSIERQITNEDETGILDRLNKGDLKLSFEITQSDRSGGVEEGSVDANTTGFIADVAGSTTSIYEKLVVTIGTGGTITIGEDNTTVTYSVTTSDGRTMVSDTVIDTLYYNVTGVGTYIRFAPGVYTANDTWYITLQAETSKTATDTEILGGR